MVAAIHAVLVLVALHWVTRVNIRKDESLLFLVLPNRAQVPAPASSAPALPGKKPVGSQDTQLLSIPAPAQPNAPEPEEPPPAIDWSAEANLAAQRQAEVATARQPRALDKHGAGADLNGGLPDHKDGSDFGWDRSHTHRVETAEGGGVVIHLNDRCVIVLIPFPFPFCGIGKIPVRGDLLDHMHDEQADTHQKNIAP